MQSKDRNCNNTGLSCICPTNVEVFSSKVFPRTSGTRSMIQILQKTKSRLAPEDRRARGAGVPGASPEEARPAGQRGCGRLVPGGSGGTAPCPLLQRGSGRAGPPALRLASPCLPPSPAGGQAERQRAPSCAHGFRSGGGSGSRGRAAAGQRKP